MIGVQDQRDVEDVLHHFIGLVAGKCVEEIACEAELRVALHHWLSIAQTVERGDDGGGLRHQTPRLLHARFDGIIAFFGIVQAEHGNRGAQHIHGSAFGHFSQKLGHFFGNRARLDQVRLQRVELRLLGKSPVP